MAFIRRDPSANRNSARKYPTKASTAFSVGDAVCFTGTADGSVVNGAVTGVPVVGICLEAKASSDATTTPLLIEIVHKGDEYLCTDITGTMTAAKVGTRCDLVNATPGQVALATTTNKDVTVTGWDGATATTAIVTFSTTIF